MASSTARQRGNRRLTKITVGTKRARVMTMAPRATFVETSRLAPSPGSRTAWE